MGRWRVVRLAGVGRGRRGESSPPLSTNADCEIQFAVNHGREYVPNIACTIERGIKREMGRICIPRTTCR
jgi:hypothetical protein